MTVEGVAFAGLDTERGQEFGPDANPVTVTRTGSSSRPARDVAVDLHDAVVDHGWALQMVLCRDGDYSFRAVKPIDPNGAALNVVVIRSSGETAVRLQATASPSTQNQAIVPGSFIGTDCLG